MANSYLIWPWRPQQKIIESLEWLTDVIEAYDGSEQRIRLRLAPRQSWAADILLDDLGQLARITMAIAGWQDKVWGWPCWDEQQKLANTLAAGSTSIPVDTRYSDYRADGLALLWSSPDSYEAVEVEVVNDSSLTLLDGTMTSQVYGKGTLIMPLRLARMEAMVKREDRANAVSKLSLTLTSIDNVDLAGAPSATQYLGYDLLSEQLLMPGDAVPRSIERAIETLDPGTGEWFTSARMEYSRITSEYRWRTSSAASTWDFRQWLHRRAGRLQPVWIPSWRDDLLLADTVSAADPVLTITDIRYRYFLASQATKQHVAILRTDGSLVCRQIVAVEAGDTGEELVTLDTALGFTDVARISFLSLQRFVADRLELAWKRPGVAELKASMVEVAA